MQLNKLVRDNIIEIISSKGGQAKWHVADEEEYRTKLYEKLREEVEEFISGEEPEEIADIQEVIEAIIKLNEFDQEDIQTAKQFKRAKRGGFEKRIILEES